MQHGVAPEATKQAVLIVGPAWVGDMVMAQALFKVLKAQQPKRAIDVLAPAWTLPLLARMSEVRNGIELPVGHGRLGWSMRRRIGHALRGQYQQAIVLPNTWKSALVPWFAGIPQRTGYRGEMRYGLLNDLRQLNKQALPKMIQRYVALAEPQGTAVTTWPRPQLVAEDAAPVLAKLGLERPQRILGLCPGAEYGPAKQWPAAYFAKLSDTWLEAHPQGEVWIFGSGKDKQVGDEISAAVQDRLQARVRNLAGHTSLANAIDLMALADAIVSNDSGLMHVAAALDRSLIAIFGSSTPEYTPPNGAPEKTRILWQGLSCSPCFKRECPLGHLNCLREIKPEGVMVEIQELSGNCS